MKYFLGLAVAKGQYPVAEMVQILRKKGKGEWLNSGNWRGKMVCLDGMLI